MGTSLSTPKRESTPAVAAPNTATQAPKGDRQDKLGNARVAEMLNSPDGEKQVDDLLDLTPSQANWIRRLRDLEMLNPKATVEDLSMAISLKVWANGQMWDKDGKSQYPGLILDYKGGDGHKNVKFDDGQKGGKKVDEKGLFDWASDKNGKKTNVNHAFPAVAATAGRSRLAAEYASFMATSGGDTMQNVAETVINQNPGQWSAGEYAGNFRGEDVADKNRDAKGKSKLSDLMLDQFRNENKPKK